MVYRAFEFVARLPPSFALFAKNLASMRVTEPSPDDAASWGCEQTGLFQKKSIYKSITAQRFVPWLECPSAEQ